jgi:hypothetical protein
MTHLKKCVISGMLALIVGGIGSDTSASQQDRWRAELRVRDLVVRAANTDAWTSTTMASSWATT